MFNGSAIKALEKRVDELEDNLIDVCGDATTLGDVMTTIVDQLAELKKTVAEVEAHTKEHCSLLELCLKSLSRAGVIEKIPDNDAPN